MYLPYVRGVFGERLRFKRATVEQGRKATSDSIRFSHNIVAEAFV